MVIIDSLICNIKCRQVLMPLFLYTDNNYIIDIRIVFYDIFEYIVSIRKSTGIYVE